MTAVIDRTWYETLIGVVGAVNQLLLLTLLLVVAGAGWSLRRTMRSMRESIDAASGALRRAAATTETRVNEFNALLEVVQQEAEQAFVSTASLVRGVRSGASALGNLDAIDTNGGRDDGDDDDESDTHAREIERSERQGPAAGAARPRLKRRKSEGRS